MEDDIFKRLDNVAPRDYEGIWMVNVSRAAIEALLSENQPLAVHGGVEIPIPDSWQKRNHYHSVMARYVADVLSGEDEAALAASQSIEQHQLSFRYSERRVIDPVIVTIDMAMPPLDTNNI